jgi:hypothetical protein
LKRKYQITTNPIWSLMSLKQTLVLYLQLCQLNSKNPLIVCNQFMYTQTTPALCISMVRDVKSIGPINQDVHDQIPTSPSNSVDTLGQERDRNDPTAHAHIHTDDGGGMCSGPFQELQDMTNCL